MKAAAEFHLRAVQSHLEAARFCHEGEQFGVAIAETYHSVLATVKVRLRERGKEPPNRHSRSLSLLYHEFVERGDVTRHVSRFVHKMQSYRDDWNYEAALPDTPEETTAEAIESLLSLFNWIDEKTGIQQASERVRKRANETP